MAEQLERRFEGVDHATMPDLWGAIEVRAQRPAPEPRGPRVAALVLAVIVAAAVIGGLLWAMRNRESQPAVQPGVNGDIGYVGPADDPLHISNFDLFVSDPATGTTMDLTPTTDAIESDAVWSPDGTKVVFFRHSQTTSQLVLLSPDGTEQVLGECAPPQPLSCALVPRAKSVAWAPDSSRLAWATDPGDGTGDILEVYDLKSGSRSTVCDTSCPRHIMGPTWSPDGSVIAFSDWSVSLRNSPDNPIRMTIWVVPVAGGDPSSISPPVDVSRCPSWARPCVIDLAPTWSPDGDRIAFLRWIPSLGMQTSVMTVAPDGSTPTKIDGCGHGQHCNSLLAWSPDGEQLAYARGPNVRIVTLGSDASHDIGLCDPCSPASLAWSPDGTSIVALATPGIDAGDEAVHLAIVDLPSDRVRTLRTGEDLGATWLPAGSSTFHSG